MKYYYKYSIMTIILINIEDKYIKVLNMSIISLKEYINRSIFVDFLNEIMMWNTTLNDDWNKRCWTLQESVLNENIYIFTSIFLNLEPLKKIIHKSTFFSNRNNRNTLFEICFNIKNYKNSYKIGNILQLTRDRECKLIQDKIYSILGLIDSRIRNNIIVDYKLNIKEIYIKLFKEAIKINDYSWINIAVNIEYTSITILYKKIYINNNNKIYLKSYIIKDIVKKIIKIYNKQIFNKKEIIVEFDKKLMKMNNVYLSEEFWDLLMKQFLIQDKKLG